MNNPLCFKQNGFIGCLRTDEPELWTGTDNEQHFRENLKATPDHPDLLRYRKDPIQYKLNQLGHRSCELSTIISSNKPYILVTGDSFTQGTGLHVHETYSYMLGKLLNLPVYNLALGGTGVDIMLHNLMIWKSVIKAPPKVLVVQWSDRARTCKMFEEGGGIVGSLYQGTSKIVDSYIYGGEETGIFETRAILADTLIGEHYKSSEIVNVQIPGWYSTRYGNTRKVLWLPKDIEPNYARDLQHTGPNNHKFLAEEILKSLI